MHLHTVCSIWPIDRVLSGATNPGQSGPRSNGNEGVLPIPQISKAGALLSDGLMLYQGHLLKGGFYPSAEMQSVYPTAPVDLAVLTGTTTLGQSGPGSNGNEEYSALPRTESSPSDIV